MSLSEISAWLVWTLHLASSVFVPLIGRFSAKARNAFVVAIAALTTFFAFTLIPSVSSGTSVNLIAAWIPGNINAGVFLDPLSVLFACLVGFFGLIIAVYSLGYMKHEENLTRYYFFFLVFIGSMIGLVISDNFLQMLIFWEMVGMCSYALISFWNNRPESVKSGNKVFIMTRIGDISLLAAIGPSSRRSRSGSASRSPRWSRWRAVPPPRCGCRASARCSPRPRSSPTCATGSRRPGSSAA